MKGAISFAFGLLALFIAFMGLWRSQNQAALCLLFLFVGLMGAGSLFIGICEAIRLAIIDAHCILRDAQEVSDCEAEEDNQRQE